MAERVLQIARGPVEPALDAAPVNLSSGAWNGMFARVWKLLPDAASRR
ncbi:hypothetical protein [Sorangium sp. So ce363]